MAVIRTYEPDYGGVEVWDDRDPDCPVYFWNGNVNTDVIDAVIAARIAAREGEFEIEGEGGTIV